MTYEIAPKGFVLKKPIGTIATWPYEYITDAKKTTISEQMVNAIKGIPTKTYLNLGILPAKFLPGFINPSSVMASSRIDFWAPATAILQFDLEMLL